MDHDFQMKLPLITSFFRIEPDDESNNEIEDKPDVPTLNVSSKDSPYALIDRFFPEREYNHEFMERNFQEKLRNGSPDIDLGNLKPNEVWLSEGDLLVLKGGGTPNRKGFDTPWKPLDDYIGKHFMPIGIHSILYDITL